MKAITIRQPYASLIAAGIKTVETRPRRTLHRGRIAIHALPLGAVVASAVLTDCVPMVHTTQPRNGHCLVVSPTGMTLHGDPTEPGTDVSDQRPFGDFHPGRWALLLDDIKPTTERCPWCWGAGRVDHPVPGVPRSVCQASTPCPVCWPRGADGEREFWADGRAGRCDPIPARGQQAVPWEWDAEGADRG